MRTVPCADAGAAPRALRDEPDDRAVPGPRVDGQPDEADQLAGAEAAHGERLLPVPRAGRRRRTASPGSAGSRRRAAAGQAGRHEPKRSWPSAPTKTFSARPLRGLREDLAAVGDVERDRVRAVHAERLRERQVVDPGRRQRLRLRAGEEQRLEQAADRAVGRPVRPGDQRVPPHVLLRAERAADAARVRRAHAAARARRPLRGRAAEPRAGDDEHGEDREGEGERAWSADSRRREVSSEPRSDVSRERPRELVRDSVNAERPPSTMPTCPPAVVTGGAGFLGSHLCEYLLGRGLRVICVDNLVTGSLGNIEHIRDDELRLPRPRPDRAPRDRRAGRLRLPLRRARQPRRLPADAAALAEGRLVRDAQRARPREVQARPLPARVHERGVRRPAGAPAAGDVLGPRQPDRPARRVRRGEALCRGADDGVPQPAGREHGDRPDLQHLRARGCARTTAGRSRASSARPSRTSR